MNKEHKLIEKYISIVEEEKISKSLSINIYRVCDLDGIITDYDFALPVQFLDSIRLELREKANIYKNLNLNLSKYFTCFLYTIDMPFGCLVPLNKEGYIILHEINYFSQGYVAC
jgi:hypothetical protein